MSTFKGTAIKPRVGLTPILRAGLGMTDALLDIFPDAPVYHLGLFREKISLQPVECERRSFRFPSQSSGPPPAIGSYCVLQTKSWPDSNCSSCCTSLDYSKLPSQPTVDLVYLLDPLIATAGTAIAALNMITDWGVSSASFLVMFGIR